MAVFHFDDFPAGEDLSDDAAHFGGVWVRYRWFCVELVDLTLGPGTQGENEIAEGGLG